MEYLFEKKQALKFTRLNVDNKAELSSYECTMAEIMGAVNQVHKGKLLEADIVIRGQTIQEQTKVRDPEFADWLRSGWKISQFIAIDYTASNGVTWEPTSLHFMGPKNQYDAAITQIGSILENYS